jgi:MFS transporter, AAHS family, 4-hydroxybenzoate transporter
MAGADQSLKVSSDIDASAWSPFQKRVLFLAALAVVLDGLDNQILGFAIPSLIAEWGVTRADFAPIVAFSLIAMTVGTAIAGYLGDLLGRRPLLICSIVLFGAGTGAIAFVDDLSMLALLRIVAALGLGGAMPNATALLAEYTPAQRRSLAVTLGIVCVPVGGLIGGIIAATVLPTYGWRALFGIGGILPLLVAAILIVALPESPSFLERDPKRHAELDRLLSRMGISREPGTPAPAMAAERTSPVKALFEGNAARDTLALWLAFFACLLAVYSMFSWAPTMLADAGFDLAVSSSGLAAFNFGGIGGALVGGWLMDRFGSKWPTVAMATLGAAVAALLAAGGLTASTSPALIMVALAVLGLFIPGLQVMLFALAAQIYPVHTRSTGVGAALAVGRLGAVASAFSGAYVLALGTEGFFGVVAVAMLLAAAALLAVSGHTSRRLRFTEAARTKS